MYFWCITLYAYKHQINKMFNKTEHYFIKFDNVFII